MARAARRPGDERRIVERAAAAILDRIGGRPHAAVVLGTGIPAPSLSGEIRFPFAEIPGLPVPSIPGHGREIVSGTAGAARVLVLTGRVHLYEGAAPAEAVRAVRAAAVAGARRLVLVNASGGVSRRAAPGRVMVIGDHLDLGGGDPDADLPAVPFGPRFVPAAGAWDPVLRRAALRGPGGRGAFEGVYAFVRGPAFETPAEVRALRTLGADAVGMSTVPEVLAARRLGMRVLGLSAITNRAGGPSDGHGAVVRAAAEAGRRLPEMVEAAVRSAGREGP